MRKREGTRKKEREKENNQDRPNRRYCLNKSKREKH